MFILSRQETIASNFLADLRDMEVQKDTWRFRKNMERIGEILAYEISKALAFTTTTIQTPLASVEVKRIAVQPVLITVLRAGLPFYQGFQNYFSEASAGFIGAFRKEEATAKNTVEVSLSYTAIPPVEGLPVILADPMLASGTSIFNAIREIEAKGRPSHIHIAAAIAAPEGVAFLEKHLKLPYTLWLGALDEKLDERAYIVPGLGDAGDLSFGPKL